MVTLAGNDIPQNGDDGAHFESCVITTNSSSYQPQFGFVVRQVLSKLYGHGLGHGSRTGLVPIADAG